jgi:hypothetical protein
MKTSAEVVTVECESAIARVVVYGRGALVTRRIAPVAAEQLDGAGEAELWLPGITRQAAPGSMSAKIVEGAGQLVAVRAALHRPEAVGEGGELAAELRGLKLRVRRLNEERRLVLERRERLLKLGARPEQSWRLRKLSAAQRLERGLAISAITGTKLAGLDGRIVALDGELVELGRMVAAVELRQAQASDAQQANAGVPTWRAMAHISAPGAGLVIEVTYMVPWACWWPTYALRLSDAGRRAALHVSALVVQDTDEDWSGVELGLSTADLTLDAQLPVLAALKLGKAQPRPKSGYRPLPEGMDRLFAAYDKHMPALASPSDTGEHMFAVMQEAQDGPAMLGDRGDGMAYGGAPPEPPRPQSMSMPVGAAMPVAAAPMPKSRGGFGMPNLGIMDAVSDMLSSSDEDMAKMDYEEVSRSAPMRRSMAGPGGGGGEMKKRKPGAPTGAAPAPVEPEDGWLDFDQLRMAGPAQVERGKLHRASRGGVGDDRDWRINSWQEEATRQGARDPRISRGLFDCRYDAAGKVDVPSDGRLHRVDLMRAEGGARLRWRAVPRERAEVYRMVYVVNPLDVPLLDGPIDVFVEGSFLATDRLARVDRGGEFLVGMGVDDRLRVARNAKMEEERAGLLGGKAIITTRVTIDVRSTLGFAAEVEVLDRVPVAGSDALAVEALEATPSATSYDQQAEGRPIQGGQRWVLRLEAGGSSKITFGYKVTLSSKEELVGGNRRED